MASYKFTHHGYAVKRPKAPGVPVFIKVYDNRQEAIIDNLTSIDLGYELIRGYDLRQHLYSFILAGNSILTFKQSPSDRIKKAAKILKKKFFVTFTGENTGKPNAITIEELKMYMENHPDEFFPPEPEEPEKPEEPEDNTTEETTEEPKDDTNEVNN